MASGCIALSLWACRKAFLAERRLIPRQSVLWERVVLPLPVARLVWAAMLVLALSGQLATLGVVSAVLLLFDLHIIAPHLLHFVVVCLGTSTHLHLFFVALYLFGGLQKLNAQFAGCFLDRTFGTFLEEWCGVKEVPEAPVLAYAALSEAFYGAFLFLFPDFAPGYVFGVALHLLILIFIAGPLGPGGFNGIVGWNIYCLYWNACRLFDPSPLVLSLDLGLQSLFLDLFIAVAFVAPILNLTTGFGERISFKMHSQNNSVFHFLVPRRGRYDGVAERHFGELSEGYGEEAERLAETHLRLKLSRIALEEAYLMPPLSVRTAASLARNAARVFGEPVLVFAVLLDGKKKTLVQT